MTIGAETRKANVTPSGTPASTKPMKSGTAEQEQKGVTTPKRAAPVAPATTLRPASVCRTLSGDTNERRKLTRVTTPTSRSMTLGRSKRKNANAAPKPSLVSRPRTSVVSHSTAGASRIQAVSQATIPAPTTAQNGTCERWTASVVIRGSRASASRARLMPASSRS